jgi:hypothetical protein
MNFKMIKRILVEDQKGMSLLTVLIFVFVLVTIVVSLLVMASNDIKLSSLHEDSTKAFYIAEAGLSEALQRINVNWDYVGQLKNVPLTANYGEGSYSVTAEEPEGTEWDTKTGIVLTSEGIISQGGKIRGRRSVEITVGRIAGEYFQIFDYALAGKYEVKLENITTKVEGDVYCDGIIRNEGIDLDGSAYTTGSYIGDPDLVTGEIKEGDQVEKIEFPSVDFLVDYYSTSGNLVYKEGNKIENQVINLNGDIYYYEGNLTIANSTIHGPGVIMAEGKINFEDGSVLGSVGEPVGLFSFDSEYDEQEPAIKFETDSDAYGILYAPTGYVKIETESKIYGSVIGAMVENLSIKIETAAEIIHEGYSGSGILPIGEPVPAVVAWQEAKE